MVQISKAEKVAQIAMTIFLILFGILAIFPFINAFAYALSDPIEVSKGVTIYPRKPTLINFQVIFARPDILPAFGISILRTIIGIGYHMVICAFASYALSMDTLPFNRLITVFAIIPMYISAGIVPTYVTIHQLGLINSFWVYIIPHAFGAYNMLVMRTYFKGIPESMRESALMDGVPETRIFLQIIAPLSAPVLAVIALWQGVWQWNAWFDAMLYVPNVKLHPLAMLLRRVITENEVVETGLAIDASGHGSIVFSPQSLRMAMLIITTLPIVFVYPFLQRYFVKGVMIGAIKG